MADILYFSTTWCGPCKMFKPIVQGVAAETNTNVQYLDAEQNTQLASKYEIRSVPTIIVTDGANTLFRHTGVMSKQQLTNMFNQFK